MILHQKQAEIAKDKHRFRVLCCGRRFGKTTLAVEEIKGIALYKEARIAYIAPTYQQARDIAWQMLLKELKPIITKTNESRLELEVVNKDGNTSLIQLKGWENIETIKGQYFDFIVVDEVAMMRNFWIAWEEYIRSTLIDRNGQAMFISTPKGFNHFYELYNLQDNDSDFKSFRYSSYDNPFLPKEELDKTKLQMTEDRFAQEIMADFRKTEGLVYKEFSRELHLKEKDDFNKIILGVDFGYTNPACILQIGIDSDNNFYVIDEWYKTQQTTEQIINACLTFKPNEVYPDPAEPDRIEEMNQKGLNPMEVSKDIPAGISKVREMFKQGKLFISPRCKNLIMELETYRYPDKKPDKNEEEKPVKENDHAVDALRYAIYSQNNNYFGEIKVAY